MRKRRVFEFFVYIVANEWLTTFPGFTAKYGLDRLVYFERYEDIRQAIAREKQIKGWKRYKKVALINSMNPEWKSSERRLARTSGAALRMTQK